MPIFMLWFLYDYPSGLSLYIFTSSMMGIFEMRVIRKVWPIDDGSKAAPVQVSTPGKTGRPAKAGKGA
jgi:membrane protein insertase Oxa1/YidC/SpoIIIJ